MTEPRFNNEAFYIALDVRRRQIAREQGRRVSWREIGRDLGISQSTFSRIGIHNESPSAQTLVKLLAWLGETDLKPYITSGEATP